VPDPPVPLLLVLDGNSLLHRAYHAAATGFLLDDDGRPVWALKGLVGYLARAAATLRPDAVLVGFDCPDHSVRKQDYPGYKAHRAEKAPDLAEQILAAPALIAATGVITAVVRGHEGDDVLASAATQARRRGWRSVLMTSDRDAFALLDGATSVLRVRNGGLHEAVLVTPSTLPDICGVQPWQYRDYAALRGDPSDNLPGVRGFGSATAARLLTAFGTVDAVWSALDGGDGASVRAVVGEAATDTLDGSRDVVERNRRLMRMRTDLPLPDLDATRLPVDYLGMRRALATRGIILGPSLWALTGRPAPLTDDELILVPQPFVWRRNSRALRHPSPDQLALF
jgi:DNA polymerase-1